MRMYPPSCWQKVAKLNKATQSRGVNAERVGEERAWQSYAEIRGSVSVRSDNLSRHHVFQHAGNA